MTLSPTPFVVPLVIVLLLYSAVLLTSRFLHDLAVPRFPRAAGALFWGLIAVGLIAPIPHLLRSMAERAAFRAATLRDWNAAARWFALRHRLGGSHAASLELRWANALMNTRRWAEAESVLVATVSPAGRGRVRAAPRVVTWLGICRYYEGRHEAAARALEPEPDPADAGLRAYLLGRLAEQAGNVDSAALLYEKALTLSPDFFPALYQAVRLGIARGRPGEARRMIRTFPSARSPQGVRAQVEALDQALAAGRLLPVVEFVVETQG